MLFSVDAENDNRKGTVPRGHAALLDHVRRHACELCTDAQYCTCNANCKEAQPIDSN